MNPNMAKARATKEAARQQRMDQCRAYLVAMKAQSAERPRVLDVCKLYAMHSNTATALINEVFGATRSHEIRAFLRGLHERPMYKTVARRFGITNEGAGQFIREQFGVIVPKPRRNQEAVAK